MISLARKYRPRRFADLLAQEHVAAALRGAVANARVGHGYLLAGPRGVGKTTAARILAMALNCEKPDPASPGEPCGACSTCQRIWGGAANLDVVEIDAASNRSVDDARDLRERAMYAASDERHYKVYIVDEAHMLTREAWNALLKILEEPPPRVVFVFATTEPQKIANTAAPVLSRLQRFDFKRVGQAAIKARLAHVLEAEGLRADDDALALIARYADGGMRDALSVLDQVLSLGEGSLSAERVRMVLGLIDEEAYASLLTAVADHDAGRVFPVIDELLTSGADLIEFMNGLAEFLRSILMVHSGAEPEGLTVRGKEVVGQLKDRLAPGDVLRMLALLTDAETAIRRSANPRLVTETLVLRWTLMDRTIDLEAVLKRGDRSGPEGPERPFVEPARPVEPLRLTEPAPAAITPEPSAPRIEGPVVSGPLSKEAMLAAWPDVIARGRTQGPLLGAVLEALTPVAVNGDHLTLAVEAERSHMVEGARRQEKALGDLLRQALGRPIRVSVQDSGQSAPVADRPKRLSDKDLKNERLRELRGLDPALDAAADALDLEIVE